MRMSGLKMITHGWPGLEENNLKTKENQATRVIITHRKKRGAISYIVWEGGLLCENARSFVWEKERKKEEEEKTNREHQQRVLNWWVLEKAKKGDVWPLKYSTKSSSSRIRRTRAINLIVGRGEDTFLLFSGKKKKTKKKTKKKCWEKKEEEEELSEEREWEGDGKALAGTHL